MALSTSAAQTISSLWPVISPKNVIFDASTTSDVKWTKDGNPAGTTYNLADFPPKYAMDHYGHLVTKPDASVPDTVWYFNFKVPTTASFECFAIIGHNFADISGGVDIELQIASDSAFTDDSILYTATNRTSAVRVGGIVPTTIVSSGAVYGRLRLEANANFVPEIGELWLGEMIVINTIPTGPFDDRKRLTNREDQQSLSGVITSYSTSYLGSEWDFNFLIGNDTAREALRDAYIESSGFKKLVLFFPDPEYTSDVYLAKGPSQLNLILNGPLIRNGDYALRESAPFRRAEDTLEAEDANAY